MITLDLKRNDPLEARDYFEHKLVFTTGPVELNHKIKENLDVKIIDVRAKEDYQAGHIPKAINLPKDLWDTCEGLSRDKVNIFYCYSQTCQLAAQTALQFAENGFSVMEIEGGFKAWKENNLDVEK